MMKYNSFDGQLGAEIRDFELSAINSQIQEKILQALYQSQVLGLSMNEALPNDAFLRFGHVSGILNTHRCQAHSRVSRK